MNAKKTPAQGRAGKRTWLRRGLLAALLLAALALGAARLWGHSPAGRPVPTPSQTGGSLPAATPAPAAPSERSAREAAYDKDVAALTALLESGAADADTQAQAARRLERLVADHQTELGLEDALQRAGFAPCLALMQNGALTVVVNAPQLTAEAGAAILSLCAAHSDVEVENIRIMAREGL